MSDKQKKRNSILEGKLKIPCYFTYYMVYSFLSFRNITGRSVKHY